MLAVVRGRDPSAVTVLLEDGAAVAGVILATGCLGLTSYTGSPVFDAIGSVMIGGMYNPCSHATDHALTGYLLITLIVLHLTFLYFFQGFSAHLQCFSLAGMQTF